MNNAHQLGDSLAHSRGGGARRNAWASATLRERSVKRGDVAERGVAHVHNPFTINPLAHPRSCIYTRELRKTVNLEQI